MMVVTECYGKNIYLNGTQVGYINRLPDGDGAWHIAGKKAARMTHDGKIAIGGKIVGYIDDYGDVYLNGAKRGELGPEFDIYLTSLS